MSFHRWSYGLSSMLLVNPIWQPQKNTFVLTWHFQSPLKELPTFGLLHHGHQVTSLIGSFLTEFMKFNLSLFLCMPFFSDFPYSNLPSFPFFHDLLSNSRSSVLFTAHFHLTMYALQTSKPINVARWLNSYLPGDSISTFWKLPFCLFSINIFHLPQVQKLHASRTLTLSTTYLWSHLRGCPPPYLS